MINNKQFLAIAISIVMLLTGTAIIARSQSFGTGGIGNPSIGFEYIQLGYSSTSGRTEVALSTAIISNTCVFILAGQSTVSNYVHDVTASSPGQVHTSQGEGAYTPTNASNVLNLNPYTGLMYRAIDPLIGNATGNAFNWPSGTFGSYASRLGDMLINEGICARVIYIPVGIGSSNIEYWLKTQGVLYKRLLRAVTLINALGWQSDANVTKLGVIWSHGQSNALPQFALGGLPLTKSQYMDYWTQMKNSLVSDGFTGKWYLSTTGYWLNAYSGTQACGSPITCSIYLPIHEAESLTTPNGLINGSDIIFVGDTDTAVPACDITCTTGGSITYRWDNVHLSPLGATKYACTIANGFGAKLSC